MTSTRDLVTAALRWHAAKLLAKASREQLELEERLSGRERVELPVIVRSEASRALSKAIENANEEVKQMREGGI